MKLQWAIERFIFPFYMAAPPNFDAISPKTWQNVYLWAVRTFIGINGNLWLSYHKYFPQKYCLRSKILFNFKSIRFLALFTGKNVICLLISHETVTHRTHLIRVCVVTATASQSGCNFMDWYKTNEEKNNKIKTNK